VRALTGDNRHTTAMRFVARRFGFKDLRETFARVRESERRERQTTSEAINQRNAAYAEMKARITARGGMEGWMRIPL
jgi:hypothetical protein